MLEFKNEEKNKDWKKLLPLRQFAKEGLYSTAYLSILVQRKSLKARKIGRNYFTTLEWFNDYLERHAQGGKRTHAEKIRNEQKAKVLEERMAALEKMSGSRTGAKAQVREAKGLKKYFDLRSPASAALFAIIVFMLARYSPQVLADFGRIGEGVAKAGRGAYASLNVEAVNDYLWHLGEEKDAVALSLEGLTKNKLIPGKDLAIATVAAGKEKINQLMTGATLVANNFNFGFDANKISRTAVKEFNSAYSNFEKPVAPEEKEIIPEPVKPAPKVAGTKVENKKSVFEIIASELSLVSDSIFGEGKNLAGLSAALINQVTKTSNAGLSKLGQSGKEKALALKQAGQIAGESIKTAGENLGEAGSNASEALLSTGEDLSEASQSAGQSTGNALKAAGENISGITGSAGNALRVTGENLGAAGSNAGQAVGGALKSVGAGLSDAGQNAGEAAGQAVDSTGANAIEGIGQGANAISGGVSRINELAGLTAKSTRQIFASAQFGVNSLFKSLSEYEENISSGLTRGLARIFEQTAGSVKSLTYSLNGRKEKLAANISGAKEKLNPAPLAEKAAGVSEKAKNGIAESVRQAGSTAGQASGSIVNSSGQMVKNAADSAGQMAENVVNSSSQAVRNVVNSSGQVAENVVNSSEQAAESVGSASSQLAQGVKDTSGQVAESVVSSSGELAKNVADSSEQAVNSINLSFFDRAALNTSLAVNNLAYGALNALSKISGSADLALASVGTQLDETNRSIVRYKDLSGSYLAGESKQSLWSALDLYARVLDLIIPDQVKRKFALEYAPLYEHPQEVAGTKVAQSSTYGPASTATVNITRNIVGGNINTTGQIKASKIIVQAKPGKVGLLVKGDSEFDGKVTVGKVARFNGGIVVAEGADFRKGLYNSSGNLTVEDDMDVHGALTVNKLKVEDTAEFSGTVNMNDLYANNITARRNLVVVNDSLIQGSELIGGNLVVNGTFRAGHTIFKSLGVSGLVGANTLSAGAGGLIVNGETTLQDRVYMTGTNVIIAGAVDLNNILDIDTNSTTALTVGDGTDETITVDTTNDIVTIRRTVNISGVLAITGNTTLTGDLIITGGAEINTSSTTAFTVGDGTDDNLIIDTLNDILTFGKASTTDQIVMNAKQITINSASTTPAILLNYDGTGSIFQIADNGVNRLIMADGGAISHIASSTDFALNINQAGYTGGILNLQDEGTARFTVADQGVTSINTASSTASALTITQNSTGNILDLYAGASNVMTVLQNGNVGIGTTSPFAKLAVAGDIYGEGIISAQSFIATSSMTAPYFTATDANATSTFAGGFSAASSLYVLQNGNVGIGTTSPWGLFSINANGLLSGTPQFVIGSSTATNFIVANNGNVGIGTASPGNRAKFEVFGANNAFLDGGGQIAVYSTDSWAMDKGGSIVLGGPRNATDLTRSFAAIAGRKENSTDGNVAGYLQFGTRVTGGDITEYMRITSIGNVGIGTTSPFELLSVAGNGYFGGNLTGANLTATGTLNVAGLTTLGYASTTQLTVTNTAYLATAGGNVGVGTAHPDYKLEVNGNFGITTGDLTHTFSQEDEMTSSYLFMSNQKSGYGNILVIEPKDDDGSDFSGFWLRGVGTNGSTAGNREEVSFTWDRNLQRYILTTQKSGAGTIRDLEIKTGTNTGQLYLTAGGNIGIGTTTPLTRLSVQGTAGSPILNIASSTGASLIYVSESGNVGLGTISPAATLDVRQSANGMNTIYSKRFTDSAPTGNFILFQNAAGDTDLFNVDINGNTTVGGNLTTIGTSTTQTLVINSSIGSHLIPTVNNTYDLGSTAKYWNHGYLNELTVNTLGAASTTISGTAQSTFTINSDNNSLDAEDMSLIFFRGQVEPNGVIEWDSTNDYFNFNQNIFVQNANTGGATQLSLKAGGGQSTSEYLKILNSSDGLLASITSTGGAYFAGNVGIGTSSPYAKLGVSGQGVFDMDVRADYFTATSTTATSTFPWLSATRSNIGTVIEGIWNGTSLTDAYLDNNITLAGGTISGASNTMSLGSDAAGDLYYRNSSGYLAPLALGTGGYVLSSLNGLPAWTATSTIGIQGRGNGALNQIAYFSDANTITSSSNFLWNNAASLFTVTGNASTTQLTTTGNTYLATTGGNVGIGTTSPANKLDIYNAANVSPNLISMGINVTGKYTGGTSGTVRAGYFGNFISDAAATDYTYVQGAAGEVYAGYDSGAVNWTGTISYARGTMGYINNYSSGAGVITEAIGGFFEVDVRAGGAGIIRNAYGINIGGASATGTDAGQTHNAYGLYIANAIASSGGDTNNGWAIYSAATENSYFAGNVGIGTASPNYKLEVNGTASTTSLYVGTLTGPLQAINGLVSASSTLSAIYGGTGQSSWAKGDLLYAGDTNSLAKLTLGTAGYILASSGGVPAWLATSTIGIQGRGNGALNQIAYFSDANTITSSSNFLWNNAASLFTVTGNASTTQLTTTGNTYLATTGGNVGIGTTSPGQLLHIAGATPGLIIQDNNSTGDGQIGYLSLKDSSNAEKAWMGFGSTANSDLSIMNIYSANLNLGTNNATRVTINNSGNVGIGTTSPSEMLNLYSASSNTSILVQATGATKNAFLVLDGGQGSPQIYLKNAGARKWSIYNDSANSDALQFYDATGARVTIQQGGNVGIGTTSPSALLAVNAPAGQPSFAIGSSTATSFVVDKSGNVGIGTAGPGAALDIQGTSGIISNRYTTSASQGSYLQLGRSNSSTIGANTLISNAAEQIGKVTFAAANGTGFTAVASIIAYSGTGGHTSSADMPAYMSFYTVPDGSASTIERLRISEGGDIYLAKLSGGISGATMFVGNSGNVGIGTTTPNQKLSIFNNAADSAIEFSSASGSDYKWTMGLDYASGYFKIASSSALGTNDRFTIDGNGNVGIGTITPRAKQEITISDTTAYSSTWNTGTSDYAPQSFDSLSIHNNNASANFTGIFFENRLSAVSAGRINLVHTADYSGDFTFQLRTTGGVMSEKMRITSGGNVGIGTTSPFGLLALNAPAGQPSFVIGSSTATRLIVDKYGNVGIGTTNPQNDLHIESAGVQLPVLQFSGTGNASGAIIGRATSVFVGTTAYDLAIRTATGKNIYFGSADSNVPSVTLLSTGNVGIGTTTPNQKLSIFNNAADSAIEFSSASGDNYKWTMGLDYASGYFKIASSSALGTNDRFTIDGNGNVGIGTSNPTQKLEIFQGNQLIWNDASLGGELLANTTFDAGTTSWAASGGTIASVAGGQSNNALQVTNTGASYGYAQQWIATTPGTRYKVTVYFKKGTSTGAVLYIGSTYGGYDLYYNTYTDTNWTQHTEYFTATTVSTSIRIGNATNVDAQTCLFDEISVKEVTGGNLALSGLLTGYAGTSGLKITGAGNVGIGTTSPWGLLAVNAPAGQPSLVIGSSTATSLIVDKNGNVGIGTAGPVAPLQVGSHTTGIRGYARLEDDGTNPPALQLADLRASGRTFTLYSGSPDAGKFSIYDASSGDTRFVIDATGNVGIGTTSPISLLEIKAADTIVGAITVGGGKITVSSIGEINSQLDFRSNDASVNSTNQIGGRIANVTEAANGSWTGLAFYTFQQSRATDLQEALRISNSGNVGIGTTSPTQLLHVEKSTTGGTVIQLTNPTAGTGNYAMTQISSDSNSLSLDALSSTWTTNGINVQSGAGIAGSGTGGLSIAATNGTSGGVLRFYTGGSAAANERMRIDYQGNVGIGTTSPDKKVVIDGGGANAQLAINDTANRQATLTFRSAGVDKWYVGRGDSDILSDSTFFIGNYVNSANDAGGLQAKLVIDTNGNVGIGTTSPGAKLDVFGTDNKLRISYSGAVYSEIKTLSAGTLDFVSTGGVYNYGLSSGVNNIIRLYDSSDNNDVKLSTSGDSWFNGGNVGIGTTSPIAKLSVKGSGTTTGRLLQLTDSANTERVTVLDNGNVGIGLTNPSGRLTVDSPYSNTPGSRSGIELTSVNGTAQWWSMGLSSSGHLAIDELSGTDSNVMTLQLDGNVGIGTTSPNFPLNLYGTNTSTDKRFRIENSAITDLISYGSANANTNLAGRSALTSQGNDLILMANGAYNMSFYTGGYQSTYERMTIASGGNVGIGTTTPSSKLYVYDSTYGSGLNIGDDVQLTTNAHKGWRVIPYSTGDVYQDTKTITGGKLIFRIGQGTSTGAATTWMTVLGSNGNVGIGTTSPVQKLDVVGRVRTSSATDYGDFFAGSLGGLTGVHIGSITNVPLTFYTNSSAAKMTINTGGNVGIGTTTPTALLHLLSTASQDLFRVDDDGAADASPFVINSAGNVGFGVAYPSTTIDAVGATNVFQAYDSTSLDSDKVTNGAFDSDTGWTKGTGATIADGVLHSDGTGAAYGSMAFQTAGTATGKLYKVTYTISNYVSGMMYISPGGYDITSIRSSNGNFTDYVWLKNASAGATFYILNGYTPFSGDIDNVVLQEVTGGNIAVRGLYTGGGATGIKVTSAGNVGIGTTTPYAKFSIVDSVATLRDVFAISTSTSGLIFKVDSYGRTYGDGAYASGADYAEYFYTADTSLKPGEVVCVDVTRDNAVKRCERGSDNNVMGIVSTRPSVVGNNTKAISLDPSHYAIIGMLGQVDAFVSAENGPVRVGDSLTSSATMPGYAMRADGGDSTVGIALESKLEGNGKIKVLISRRNKSLAVEEIEKLVSDRVADMAIEDEVNRLIADGINKLNLDSKIGGIVDPKLFILSTELTVAKDDLTSEIENLKDGLSTIANGLIDYNFAIGELNNKYGLMNTDVSSLKEQIAGLESKLAGVSLDASGNITFSSAKTDTASSTAESIAATETSGAQVSINLATTSQDVAIVEIDTATTTIQTAFVVNQAGEGDVVDFQSNDVSIMNISSGGKVAIVGELEVDGRLMVCSSGACSSRLDEKVDDTMGDLGVEGKVVAGAYEGYCDEGYIWVPGSAEYGTLPGFCTMANRASMGDKPQSIDSSAAYWTNLSQGEADIRCQSLGEGYHLMGDNEWLTIAENITRVAANDSDAGKEGLQLALAAGKYALTNGNNIYGLTGTGEWTKGIANRGDLPLVGSFGWAEYGDVSSYKSLGIIRPPYYMTDADNGIGKIMTGETGGNVRGYIRGVNGIYGLDLSHAPTESLPEVGFRCAK